ncbi:MAG: DUF861 domain-containing protein [Chloroflexi bacterium]|nr:DUF861 domain-containing protein [Chloroflexota bacterium]
MAVVLVEGKSLRYERNPYIKGDNAKQAIGAPESKHMCSGLWRFDPETAFDWHFKEGDFILYLTEGRVQIAAEGKTYTAAAGDFTLCQKGTTAHFSTVNGAAGLYVGEPGTFFEDMAKSSRPKQW